MSYNQISLVWQMEAVQHCHTAVMRVLSFTDCVLMTLNVNNDDMLSNTHHHYWRLISYFVLPFPVVYYIIIFLSVYIRSDMVFWIRKWFDWNVRRGGFTPTNGGSVLFMQDLKLIAEILCKFQIYGSITFASPTIWKRNCSILNLLVTLFKKLIIKKCFVLEFETITVKFQRCFYLYLKDLNAHAGIDLENIVYYKDETHYFVMTAKKQSLLFKGVLKQVTI